MTTCPDCHGKREIVLFTSTVKCGTCNGIGHLGCAALATQGTHWIQAPAAADVNAQPVFEKEMMNAPFSPENWKPEPTQVFDPRRQAKIDRFAALYGKGRGETIAAGTEFHGRAAAMETRVCTFARNHLSIAFRVSSLEPVREMCAAYLDPDARDAYLGASTGLLTFEGTSHGTLRAKEFDGRIIGRQEYGGKSYYLLSTWGWPAEDVGIECNDLLTIGGKYRFFGSPTGIVAERIADRDTVPAMLDPGTNYISRETTERYYVNLRKLNEGG